MKIQKAKDDVFNRKLLERKEATVLLSPENAGPDKLKALNSGLNEITCRIATKNKIAIGIDLNEIKTLSRRNKAVRLARIIQNIRLCRKNKTQLYVTAPKRETRSFLRSLGASTEQASKSQSF